LLAGEPHRAAGTATWRRGVDVSVAALLEHVGGVVTQLDCSLERPQRCELELVGDAGTLTVHDPWVGRESAVRLRRDGLETAFPQPVIDPYQLQLDDFSAAIRSGCEPRVGPAEIVAQAKALEMVADGIRCPASSELT
jgi:predicted dehydrogenase